MGFEIGFYSCPLPIFKPNRSTIQLHVRSSGCQGGNMVTVAFYEPIQPLLLDHMEYNLRQRYEFEEEYTSDSDMEGEGQTFSSSCSERTADFEETEPTLEKILLFKSSLCGESRHFVPLMLSKRPHAKRLRPVSLDLTQARGIAAERHSLHAECLEFLDLTSTSSTDVLLSALSAETSVCVPSPSSSQLYSKGLGRILPSCSNPRSNDVSQRAEEQQRLLEQGDAEWDGEPEPSVHVAQQVKFVEPGCRPNLILVTTSFSGSLSSAARLTGPQHGPESTDSLESARPSQEKNLGTNPGNSISHSLPCCKPLPGRGEPDNVHIHVDELQETGNHKTVESVSRIVSTRKDGRSRLEKEKSGSLNFRPSLRRTSEEVVGLPNRMSPERSRSLSLSFPWKFSSERSSSLQPTSSPWARTQTTDISTIPSVPISSHYSTSPVRRTPGSISVTRKLNTSISLYPSCSSPTAQNGANNSTKPLVTSERSIHKVRTIMVSSQLCSPQPRSRSPVSTDADWGSAYNPVNSPSIARPSDDTSRRIAALPATTTLSASSFPLRQSSISNRSTTARSASNTGLHHQQPWHTRHISETSTATTLNETTTLQSVFSQTAPSGQYRQTSSKQNRIPIETVASCADVHVVDPGMPPSPTASSLMQRSMGFKLAMKWPLKNGKSKLLRRPSNPKSSSS